MTPTWRTAGRARALALTVAGAGFGLLTLSGARSAPGGSFGGSSWVGAAAELGAGWTLIAAGAAESWRRPASRAGLLLIAAGIGWFFADWNNPGLGSAGAFTFGLIVYALAAPLVALAALAYPTGRLKSRLAACVLAVAGAGAGLALGLLPALFFDPARQGCGLCPANLVLVHSEPGLVDGLLRAGVVLGLAWTTALVATLTARLGQASPPLRRVLWPVLVPAGAFLILAGADFAHSLPRGTLGNDPVDYRLWLAQAALLVLMAAGAAWGWVRDRRTRAAVVRLVMDAAQSAPPGGLRDVLARLLKDPGLELAYPVGQPPRNVRADGRPASIEPGAGQHVTPLVRGGQTVATLRHRAGLLDDPGMVREVAAAARLGMENERLRAEVLAQVDEIRAAQARIVAAGDAERRRLERDLHDGAQQRLVGLSLALRLVRPPPAAGGVARLVDQADRELRLSIDELRKLAHGIYPVVLADEGLAAAVEALAEDSPVPVTMTDFPPGRHPAPVESAGYFLIAEACELIAAVAAAERITVGAKHDGERLTVQIISAAAASAGAAVDAGLRDVGDRVGALGGSLRVESAPDGAITIRAELPCA